MTSICPRSRLRRARRLAADAKSIVMSQFVGGDGRLAGTIQAYRKQQAGCSSCAQFCNRRDTMRRHLPRAKRAGQRLDAVSVHVCLLRLLATSACTRSAWPRTSLRSRRKPKHFQGTFTGSAGSQLIVTVQSDLCRPTRTKQR